MGAYQVHRNFKNATFIGEQNDITLVSQCSGMLINNGKIATKFAVFAVVLRLLKKRVLDTAKAKQNRFSKQQKKIQKL